MAASPQEGFITQAVADRLLLLIRQKDHLRLRDALQGLKDAMVYENEAGANYTFNINELFSMPWLDNKEWKLTLLGVAAEYDLECLKVLLSFDAYASATAQMQSKSNALMQAVIGNNIECFDYLHSIDNGFISHQVPTSSTCLHYAALSNASLKLFARLIELKVDVNAQDKYGLSVLHEAALKNSIEFCQLLIENGADINLVSLQGETPLIKALKCGRVGNAFILLLHGAKFPENLPQNEHRARMQELKKDFEEFITHCETSENKLLGEEPNGVSRVPTLRFLCQSAKQQHDLIYPEYIPQSARDEFRKVKSIEESTLLLMRHRKISTLNGHSIKEIYDYFESGAWKPQPEASSSQRMAPGNA